MTGASPWKGLVKHRGQGATCLFYGLGRLDGLNWNLTTRWRLISYIVHPLSKGYSRCFLSSVNRPGQIWLKIGRNFIIFIKMFSETFCRLWILVPSWKLNKFYHTPQITNAYHTIKREDERFCHLLLTWQFLDYIWENTFIIQYEKMFTAQIEASFYRQIIIVYAEQKRRGIGFKIEFR